jgi:hypothetical protein
MRSPTPSRRSFGLAAAAADEAAQAALEALLARNDANLAALPEGAGPATRSLRVMSHIIASFQPPPRANPDTPATIGLRRFATRSQGVMKSSR